MKISWMAADVVGGLDIVLSDTDDDITRGDLPRRVVNHLNASSTGRIPADKRRGLKDKKWIPYLMLPQIKYLKAPQGGCGHRRQHARLR